MATALLPSLLTACQRHDAQPALPADGLFNAAGGMLPTEALLTAADSDLPQALAAVQRAALLAAVQALPATTAATLQVRWSPLFTPFPLELWTPDRCLYLYAFSACF